MRSQGMKKRLWVYWLVPVCGVAAFAGFDRMWQKQQRIEARTFEWDQYTGRDGHQEAIADLARGKLGTVTYGMPAHWTREYHEILMRDYGIVHRSIAGCIVSEGITSYAAAYNAVMLPRIHERHGAKVFEEAAAKAESLYNERHPPLTRE